MTCYLIYVLYFQPLLSSVVSDKRIFSYYVSDIQNSDNCTCHTQSFHSNIQIFEKVEEKNELKTRRFRDFEVRMFRIVGDRIGEKTDRDGYLPIPFSYVRNDSVIFPFVIFRNTNMRYVDR